MGDLLLKLQRLDRRVIYVALAVGVAVPLLVHAIMPVTVSPTTRSLYKAINRLPRDKLVILAIDWDAATRAENEPQTEAVMKHLMKRGIRFAVVSFINPWGPQFGELVASRVSKELGKKYGVDWVNLGYVTGGAIALRSFVLCKDIVGFFRGRDAHGRPLVRMPVMEGIRDFSDVSTVVEFTGGGGLEDWIAFANGLKGTPIGHGCTAVIAPRRYQFIDSGQLEGMLVGLVGAAEYRKLVDRRPPEMLQRMVNSQSVAHALIILFIVLGNAGYFVARRRGMA